jgi:hypothetical protein
VPAAVGIALYDPAVGLDREESERLRADLEAASALPDRNERLLEAAAVIADALQAADLTPVVVGGLAVAYWTDDNEITNEIDVVVAWSPELDERMRSIGLVKAGSRFWVTPDDKIAWEAPGSSLKPEERIEQVELPSGRIVRVLSVEDTLIWRLHEFLGTGHRVPFEQALLLLKVKRLDHHRLFDRATQEGLSGTLEAVERAATEISDGRVYETWELHDMARELQ